ncbi:MAG: fumarylacetoacetase, partial [Solirubrobacteraceae bacterium]
MSAATWVPLEEGTPFGPAILPYGCFSPPGGPPRVGVRIGEHVLDLAGLARDRLIGGFPAAEAAFAAPGLDVFMASGPDAWRATRERLAVLLADDDARPAVQPHLHALEGVALRLPFMVADYTDFYASLHHATNLGRLLRPGDEPLAPNWRHLPVGYHGRAGTVVVSGTDVVRPSGQYLPDGAGAPAFGPTRRLDVELELGFVIG